MTHPELTAAVDALRALVDTLRTRTDVRLTTAKIGAPVTEDALRAHAAGRSLPTELIELYRRADGIYVEWSFVEPSGGGCLRIPALGEYTRFEGDESTYMNFGPGVGALLLDEIQPEGATWLVRDRDDAPTRIVFASTGRGRDGFVVAASLAEYLHAAVDRGLVYYWPACFRADPSVSYAAQEIAIERFRAPPVSPARIEVGARVQFMYFAEEGRGTVVDVVELAPSVETEHTGTSFVRVDADVGVRAWIPARSLRAFAHTDAYERLRDPTRSWGEHGDSERLFDALARALGPLESYSSMAYGALPSNARRAAGLLGPRGLVEATYEVLGAYFRAQAEGVDLRAAHVVKPHEDDLVPHPLARFREMCAPRSLFEGLAGGLTILACRASASRNMAPQELLDADGREAARDIPELALFSSVIERADVLAPLHWHAASEALVAGLGLPDRDLPVWIGSGC
jgi:hypothetical protein